MTKKNNIERIKPGKVISDAELSTENAVEIIKDRLAMVSQHSFGIRYADIDDDLQSTQKKFQIEWSRSFSVGCTLYVGLHPDLSMYERWSELLAKGVVKEPEDAMPKRYIFKAEINWAGTSRSTAEATASIALYQEAVNIAADLEAALGDTIIGTNLIYGEDI